MPRRYHANNKSTTLTAAIATSSTSISVASSTGFPAITTGEIFHATLSQSGKIEIVIVTAVSGTTWTVTRAAEGTTAQAFLTGASVDLRVTADSIDRKLDKAASASDTVDLSLASVSLGTPVTINLTNATSLPSGSVVGVTNASSAGTGVVGQVLSSSASSVAISSGSFVNVTSLSLTAGDWDVYGSLQAQPAVTTTTNQTSGGISTTSATLPSAGSCMVLPAGAASIPVGGSVPTTRINVSATTTVYLVAFISYAVSTCTVSGALWARRAR